MEEGLVLDRSKTRVVQELAVHELSWLLDGAVGVGVVVSNVLCVFHDLDVVLASLLVELALHQDVEEQGNGCKIGQPSVDIDCPELRMALGIRGIWKANQIDSNMSNQTFSIEHISNRMA